MAAFLLIAHEAKTILEETGAADIASAGGSKGDIQNTDKPMLRGSAVQRLV